MRDAHLLVSEKNHLGSLGVDGKIILKRILATPNILTKNERN
jgi:hypothetical protein